MAGGSRRKLGQWDTVANPFNHPPARQWLAEIGRLQLPVVEPFCGSGNLVAMLPGVRWAGFYDIEPRSKEGIHIQARDTIAEFPAVSDSGIKYEAVITNPPWLYRRSASARGIEFPDYAKFDDLYLDALAVCLAHVNWVAAILPESFIRSGLFLDRLWAVISLPSGVFAGETEHPSCLVLFTPEACGDPEIWRGEGYLGTLSQLTNHPVLALPIPKSSLFGFCRQDGEVGIHCVDSRTGAMIRFVTGDTIPSGTVKRSSRHIVRVKLPIELTHEEVLTLIDDANILLADFRTKSCDVPLTSARSYRRGDQIRRRLDFATAAKILSLCLSARGLLRSG